MQIKPEFIQKNSESNLLDIVKRMLQFVKLMPYKYFKILLIIDVSTKLACQISVGMSANPHIIFDT